MRKEQGKSLRFFLNKGTPRQAIPDLSRVTDAKLESFLKKGRRAAKNRHWPKEADYRGSSRDTLSNRKNFSADINIFMSHSF
jgi:hypothetical protein